MVTDNKKIAKNTLFLYIRMLLLIVVDSIGESVPL